MAGHPRTTAEARVAGTRPAMTEKRQLAHRKVSAHAVEPGHDGA
jgi:hypothetical protein